MALVLLLAACSSPPVPVGMPEAEVGTGDTKFDALTAGQTIDLHAGCQGGYHVWGAVRARNLNPSSPVLDFRMTRVRDGADVLYMPIHVRSTLTPATDGWYEGYAYTLRVVGPTEVLDEDVDIGVTVTDRTGLVATDVRRVHVINGASVCPDGGTFDAFDGAVPRDVDATLAD